MANIWDEFDKAIDTDIHNHVAVLIVGLELNINRISHFRNQRPHELIGNVNLTQSNGAAMPR